MPKTLTVADVSKRYPNGVRALSGVSFDVDVGVVVAVIGHNGAGKSTLLNIISGLIAPTAGRVIRHDPSARLSWAPQRTTVDWSLTVEQNVALVAELTGTASQRVDQVIELLDLGAVRTSQAEYISGGQLQRVQIARALVAEAGLYVLDEPAAGLDPTASEVVMRELERWAHDGRTVLVSSHDLDAVERSASRLLLLDGGQVVANMPVSQFVNEAGARSTVQVTVDEAVAEGVTEHMRRSLPDTWTLDVAQDRTNIAVATPLAVSLHDVLSWLPHGLSIVDVTVDRQSLRDVYLARYAQTPDSTAGVVG